jgi:hypothetical protein
VLAAISQAETLLPPSDGVKSAGKMIISQTSDELPQWTRKLLAELSS